MFEVHKLNPEGIRKARVLHSEFSEFLWRLGQIIDELKQGPVSNGRELAIMKTKLEEASFYAKRAMALDPRNQEPSK
jgi:hypothetical protein